MSDYLALVPDWTVRVAIAALVLLAVAIGHWLAFGALRRITARTAARSDNLIVDRLHRPVFWLAMVVALAAVAPSLPLSPELRALWLRAVGIAAPGLLGWIVLACMGAARDIMEARADISVADNLRARRRRTRITILHRVAVFIVVLIIICLMLMSIPSVRAIGVTLIASAGLAGLAIGAAAQPALKNLIAGVQMAFTEPIRIDDVVIIDSEWGRIEEIRLTYVVVRIWDDRRLVVPVSRFLEDSFQNWTRETSALLGTAFLHVDPATDVGRLRAHLEEVVRPNPNWDGRVVGLQVTDLKPDSMELRCLVSAADAPRAFDLRCDVREAMMAFIRDRMPEALPRFRRHLIGSDGADATSAAPG